MGGVGSGGHKTTAGDVETHAAWTLVDPAPGTPQKLRQARCNYCSREMAQHTSRQRTHLLTCRPYLQTMGRQGVENSITRQAVDPAVAVAAMLRSPRRRSQAADGRNNNNNNNNKKEAVQRWADFPVAVRIQALALAEASVSYDRIVHMTGMEPKLVDALRKTARDRGYDPSTSPQLSEEYVRTDSGCTEQSSSDGPVGGSRTGDRAPSCLIPGYVPADMASHGNWRYMAANALHPGPSIG